MDNSEKQTKQEKKIAWWQPAMVLFAKFSGWIAVPVLIGAFLGKWLDNRYESEPWWFLGMVGLAFFVSMIGVGKIVAEEYKRIEKEIKEDKEK